MSIEPILPPENSSEAWHIRSDESQKTSSGQSANLVEEAVASVAVVAAAGAVEAAEVAAAAAVVAVAAAETVVGEMVVPKDFECSSHRFPPIDFRGERWDFAHLDPFAIRLDVGESEPIDVIVLFSNHCFTASFLLDGTTPPSDSIYRGDRETRVLDRERFELSKAHLPRLIKELSCRKIQVAGQSPQNYFTFEVIDQNGTRALYTVFFEVERAPGKRRVVLRVQSAYLVKQLTARLKGGGKVRLTTLVRAAHEGRIIRG